MAYAQAIKVRERIKRKLRDLRIGDKVKIAEPVLRSGGRSGSYIGETHKLGTDKDGSRIHMLRHGRVIGVYPRGWLIEGLKGVREFVNFGDVISGDVRLEVIK